MNKVKFSICIPNFNYGHLIDKTIASVLNQKYSNFEIIISDNASTDNSVDVINSFKDGRIKLFINNINIGFSPNLDKVTLNASGDYLILLSSDDTMAPNALEEYERIINSYNGLYEDLIIMSGANVIDENNNIVYKKNAKTGDVNKFLNTFNLLNFVDENKIVETYDGHLILKGLLTSTFQPAGQFLTTCFSKKLYNKVEGYNTSLTIYPDAFFCHKLLFLNPKIIYINKFLFSYREHSFNNHSQISRMKNIKNLTDNYIISQSYGQNDLNKIGLSLKSLIETFNENIINRPAFYAVLRGNFKNALRILSFGFAAYGNDIFKSSYFYFTLFLFPFTPFLKLMNYLNEKK